MPFSRCLAAALADGQLTQTEHDHYQDVFAGFERDYRGHMPADEAAAEAARETFRYIEEATAERRRQLFLSLAAKKDIENRLATAKDPYKEARALYDRLVQGRKGFAVEQQHEFWRGLAHGELDEAFTTWQRNMLGQRREMPRAINIVREIFGERTGDNAAEMLAAGWKRASEMLRQAFNRFGGHIAHLEDWGLPQNHRADLMREAGFETWAEFITPMLDRSRMLDRDTGRPLDDAQLREALGKTYESILTAGWDDREPTSAHGRALANRRDEHRFLHFRDADNWLAYQQRFGEGDPVNAMLAHVEAMSRDVAHMQVMGPNPASTLEWVKQVLSKKAALDNAPEGTATAAHVALNKLYSNYSRSNAAPVNPKLAHAIDDLGNLLSAAQLGSASVLAVPSDLNFQRLARRFNGLPEVKALTSYVKLLASNKNKMAAIKAGLGAQHYAQVLGQQGRYIGEIYGHRWSRWISERVLEASGLSPWTAAGRMAFGLDFYGHVADQAGHAFAELHPDFAAMLQRYRIGPEEWDKVRSTPAMEVNGAHFVRPADIMARTDMDNGAALDIAGRLADAAMTETEFAVPSGSLMARAAITGLDHPGELISVVKRSTAMYRTFGSTLLLTHGRRMASLAGQPQKLAKYAAALVIGSTVAGALGLQAKEILAGRDPRPMDDWRFWLSAFVAGGGGGLLADFIYAGVNGTTAVGQGLASAVGGPIAGFLSDVANTVFGPNGIGAVSQQTGARAKNIQTRALEFARRYLPGGNIWYARLAIEREIMDQLQSLIDPGWQMRSARIERWYQKSFGSTYWWHRGDTAPERAPDLSKAAGGTQ